jgi:ParB family chromosome partitioning protein
MPKTTARKSTSVEEFDPARVRPLPDQPRKRFRGIRELAESITEIGQQCPGIVTLIDGHPDFDAQLVDGERRLRACKLAGVGFRAEVRPNKDADAIFAESFAANFGKQDHDAIEIAEGLARLQKAGKTIEQLGRIAGRGSQWVSAHLSLLQLHPEVRALMVKGEDRREDESAPLTFSLALLLVPMPQDRQLAAAKKIVSWGLSLTEARRFILQQRVKSGEKDAYLSKRGPQRSIETIGSVLSDTANRIGIYLDMPGPDFKAMLEKTDAKTKSALVGQIDRIVEDLTGLAEVINAQLQSTAKKAA